MRFIDKLNSPLIVVLVLAFFLTLDGYLLFRYQQNPAYDEPSDDNYTATQSTETIDSIMVEENTTAVTTSASENARERTDEAAAFVHLAASETIVANSTYVDHPFANGNSNAILMVERGSQRSEDANRTPKDANRTPNIGVWYDANRGNRWAVFNQNRAPMSEGTTFRMVVREEPSNTAFVHRATSENIVNNSTYIDHPLTNGNPDAVLSVTQNWNPGGGAGTYNDHSVGVRYDADEEKWAILNQDLRSMPEGAAFNIAVS